MTDELAPPADVEVRLRDAFASVAEVTGGGTHCPTAPELWESAAGRGSRRSREAVILHLGECTACAAAWRLARDLQKDDAAAKVLPGPPRWFRQRWVQVVGLAAVLVLAVGITTVFRTAHAPEFRGEEGDWIQALVPEEGPLPRERCLLRWSSGPEGTVYDVRVTTEDLAPVARRRGLERAEFLVPAESLKGVPSQARIVWQVTAHLPDGSKSDSRSFTNEVR